MPPIGRINWGSTGQVSNPSATGFSGGRINWGGIYANDRALQKTQSVAIQNEQNQLKQQQQSKGINNPQSLLNLQTQLRTKQITPQQFMQQFGQASKGAAGVPQSDNFKVTRGAIAGQAATSAKNIGTGFAKGLTQSEQTTANVLSRLIPGGQNDLKAENVATDQANKNRQFINQQVQSGKMKPATAVQLLNNSTQDNASQIAESRASIPTRGQAAAGVLGTAADILTAGTLPEVKGAGVAAKTARAVTTPAAFGVASGANAAAGGGTKKQIAENTLAGAAFPLALHVAGKGIEAAKNVKSKLTPLNESGSGIPEPTPKVESTSVKTPESKTVPTEQSSIKQPSTTKLNEAGGLPVGKAQDLIDKHQQTVKYSGDIQRFAASSEGAKGNLLNDSAKLIKNRAQLAPEEKVQLQALRDARATKQELPQVSDKVTQADKETTAFAKATIQNDAERAKLEGNLQKAKEIQQRDPESYTHRVARGKGSAFDYVLQNDRKNPLSVGFGKTTPADKSRTMFTAVDEKGNRRVISIKTQTGKNVSGQKVTNANQITAFENGKPVANLGNLKSKANTIGQEFKGKDGKTYKIDNATAAEIEKNTKTKYFTDPSLTNHAAYLDSRLALENARMFDAIKKAPESRTFMVEPGETAPKGYKPAPGVAQFQGYKFEPRVAETITDLFGAREPATLNKLSQALRQSIVYFPLKHDFNMTAAYAMDRGASSLANPASYARMFKSWGQAFNDIRTKSDFYQNVAKGGFGLTTNDKTEFEKAFKGELQKITPGSVKQIAKLSGLNPVRLYTAMQRLSVWDVQDFLNLARIHERMQPGILKKGMSMEDAIKQTEKYSFQYKTPSRVAGSRTAARALKSPVVFFGAYKYDQYKMVANAIKGMLNVTKPGEALKNADKVAALAVGSLLLWPKVNKEIQNLSGNKNAHMTAPGPLALPETANKVRTGKQNYSQALSGQVSIGPVQQGLDVKNNTDSFTGKKIADPNASEAQQAKQKVTWLSKQLAPVQKTSGGKNAAPDKQVTGTILSLAGATLPKNSPEATKLNSLKYDSLPLIQAQAKSQAANGDFHGASDTISKYDDEVRKAAAADAKSKGQSMPSEKSLKKGGYFYSPKQSTIHSWAKGKKTVKGAFTP